VELILDKVSLARGPHPVLEDVRAELATGTRIAVCGPNGAGKSTLLAALAGDLRPRKGRIRLGDVRPARASAARLARLRAMLVQQNALDHPFPVDRVLALGDAGADARRRALALAEVGIDDLVDRPCTELSGGELRLVHLARVLLQLDAGEDGNWLLLDEPASHLDLGMAERAMRAAARRAAAGRGVIAVLHDLELASRWAERVLVLAGGRLVADGTPAQALTREVVTEGWGLDVQVDEAPDGAGLVIRPVGGPAPVRRPAPPPEDPPAEA
jgi:iron complex transport system ATP-binding protein